MTTRNKTVLLFTTALLVLLLGISMTAAADTNTTQTPTHIDQTSQQTADTITAHSDNKLESNVAGKVVSTEKQVSTAKNIKQATVNKEVNNYQELQQTVAEADSTTNTDEYNIKLNNGTYTKTWSDPAVNWGTNNGPVKNIAIDGNSQVLNGALTVNNNYSMVLNNVNLASGLTNRGNVTFSGGILNGSITNNGVLVISDDTQIASKAYITNNGVIVTNKTDVVNYYATYNGTYTLNNVNMTVWGKTNNGNLTFVNSDIRQIITNRGNLTIKSSTLNYSVYNYGTFFISDDTVLGSQFEIWGNGTVVTNKTDITLYYQTYNGNYTFNNVNVTKSKTNTGNLTYVNSNIQDGISNIASLTLINTTLRGSSSNPGNLTLINSVINGTINNKGRLIIDDNTVMGTNGKINGNGVLVTNNTDILVSLATYNSNYTFNNVTLTGSKTNNGNLTLTNSVINATISNNGRLIIDDNTVIGSNGRIDGNGVVITNNTDILASLTIYNGNYTLNNVTLTGSKTNIGNLTLINSVINGTINNNGHLIIDDNTVMGTNGRIVGNGVLITNNTDILVSLATYNGNYTFNNVTLTGSKTNNGNLTLINSVINSSFTNRGNLVLINSTINGTGSITNYNTINVSSDSVIDTLITNRGTLIISDNVVFGEKALFDVSKGNIVTNKTITNYLQTYNGNNTLSNLTISTRRTNNGNLTLDNCIINATINNKGTLIINDNTVFGNHALISGSGNVISNRTDIYLYSSTVTGNHTVSNITIGTSRTMNGNLTFINAVFTGTLTNNGNLTLINATLKNPITNYGNLNIINSTFCNNTINSVSSGAFIYNRANATLVNVLVDNNTVNRTSSTILGSIIYNRRGSILSIDNSTFSNNYAIANRSTFSSMIENRGSIVLLNNTKFINNTGIDIREDIVNSLSYAVKGINNTNITNCVFEGNNGAVSGTNLNITNSTFRNNIQTYTDRSTGPNGGAVNVNGYLNIDNSTFTGNGLNLTNEYTTVGGMGGAIYVTNGNITVKNTIFNGNFIYCNSSWTIDGGAAIAVDYPRGSSTIENNTFTNNHITSPDGQVMPEYDWDGSSSGSGADFYVHQDVIYTNIIINSNTFTNSSSTTKTGSIYIPKLDNAVITNNTFTNVQAQEETISINTTNRTIANNTYYNDTISFKTLNLTAPDRIHENETVTVTGNIELRNPDNYDEDILDKTNYTHYINGVLSNSSTLGLNITLNTTDNIIIYAVPSIANTRSNIIVLKTTQMKNVNITPENYNTFVLDGNLIGIDEDSIITFNGNFTNKSTIIIDTPNIIINGQNATFTNTGFQLEADNITITNMKINNTQTSEYAISTSGNNNIIANNTITVNNTQGKTAAIANQNGENNTITQNNITVYGPTESITFTNGANAANTQGILSAGGENNQITYNNIHVYNSTNPDDNLYSTVEGITAPGRSNNVLIAYNNVTVTGGRFNYGIDALGGVNNTQIKENNIHVTGHRYIDGIQIGNMATNSLVTANNITGTCYNTTVYTEDNEPMAFGIITSNMGTTTKTNNITITDNNINLNSSIVYGMEIYQTANSTINNNTINANGNYTMGLSLAHSPDNTVENNTMNLHGNSNTPVNYIVEEIRPANTGVQVQQESDNSRITGNNIKVNDIAGNDTAVNVDNNNIRVTDNKLTTSKNTGNNAVTRNGENITVANNTLSPLDTIINLNPVNTTLYENTNITATITDERGNNVTSGQVFFKINGKTLTDTYGNIIYVDVINGTAALDYYADSVKANTTTIVYVGNQNYNTARVNSTINVAKANATMKLEILNDNIKPGEEAIIMVTVTDKNGNMVKSGKVIFKLNGKTIKDANGSAITVRIHNGVAVFRYIVPANYSAKNYTLTAVSVGNTYNRVEAATNLTLIKINTYIQNVNTYFTGNTLHVQANIISTSTQKNVAYRETKVSIKINNKTFAKEVRITNGTIDLNIDTSTIGRGQYKITIKAGENGIYNGSQLDTYTYKASVKSALNQTSSNGTLVKA